MAQSLCCCFQCEEVEARVAMKRAASFDLRVVEASCYGSQTGCVLTPCRGKPVGQVVLFSDMIFSMKR